MPLDKEAYCTVKQVKEILNLGEPPEDSTYDVQILGLIQSASQFVHTYCKRSFIPYMATRAFPYGGRAIYSPKWLCPDEEMLEVTAIINGDSSSVSLVNVVLEPLATSAKHTLCIKDAVDLVWLPGNIIITSIWGYHPYYVGAWRLVGVLEENLVETDDTIVFASAILSGGEFIRVGSELMFVDSPKVGTPNMDDPPVIVGPYTYDLARDINGYTSADHLSGVSVYRFEPVLDVALATARLVTWLFKTGNSVDTRIQLTDNKTNTIIQQSPSEIWAMLEHHVKRVDK